MGCAGALGRRVGKDLIHVLGEGGIMLLLMEARGIWGCFDRPFFGILMV